MEIKGTFVVEEIIKPLVVLEQHMEAKNDKSNLEKLREITSHLADLKTVPVDHPPNAEFPDYLTQYSVRPGMCVAKGLLKNKDVAVLDTILQPGTIIVPHVHECHEWAIIYCGALDVITKDGKSTYGVNEVFYAPPNAEHGVSCQVFTRLICVTIPQDEAYPNVG